MYSYVLVHTLLYLTIGAELVLVFTSKPVYHLNNVGYASMMQPEPAILRHVSVCNSVALLRTLGIMPSTRHAQVLPDAELRLRTVT